MQLKNRIRYLKHLKKKIENSALKTSKSSSTYWKDHLTEEQWLEWNRLSAKIEELERLTLLIGGKDGV